MIEAFRWFYLGGVVATLFSVSLRAYVDDRLDLSILLLAAAWPVYLLVTPWAIFTGWPVERWGET